MKLITLTRISDWYADDPEEVQINPDAIVTTKRTQLKTGGEGTQLTLSNHPDGVLVTQPIEEIQKLARGVEQ